jgi:hypothetical protein
MNEGAACETRTAFVVLGLIDAARLRRLPGDWRLPTDAEWRTTTGFAANNLGCRSGNGPSLTDDAGTKCLSVGLSSFAGVVSASYWSGSTYTSMGASPSAWTSTSAGSPNASDKDFFSYRVWPVRVAPR